MTLYLLFEKMESGRIGLDTELDVSEHAASQSPTKLGLRPGGAIRVEDAIKGLVTKSANDAAVVVAEALGGTEEEFARAMTRKAHALGMRHTLYRNASGLPDDEQVTTARDQALLGIAIQERFPKQYRYFSLASFVYHGSAMANHNHLLGRVDGVDGIKTGYTRASGFNLVTSVKRGARRIVAVVLGGRSGGARDARMRELIASHIAEASTKDTGPVTAEAAAKTTDFAQRPQLADKIESAAKSILASAGSTPVSLPPLHDGAPAATALGAQSPITPIRVKTVAVKLVSPKRPATPAVAEKTEAPSAKVEEAEAEPSAHNAQASALTTLPARALAAAKDAAVPTAKAEEALTHHTARSGWVVQVGAFEELSEAKDRLSSAQSKTTILQKAEAYTERTIKGAKTYFRARFAGLDRDRAEAACRQLKRNEIACMAMKI
jgi:D-alanyl-D-alanine carboxypeptidase